MKKAAFFLIVCLMAMQVLPIGNMVQRAYAPCGSPAHSGGSGHGTATGTQNILDTSGFIKQIQQIGSQQNAFRLDPNEYGIPKQGNQSTKVLDTSSQALNKVGVLERMSQSFNSFWYKVGNFYGVMSNARDQYNKSKEKKHNQKAENDRKVFTDTVNKE